MGVSLIILSYYLSTLINTDSDGGCYRDEIYGGLELASPSLVFFIGILIRTRLSPTRRVLRDEARNPLALIVSLEPDFTRAPDQSVEITRKEVGSMITLCFQPALSPVITASRL